MPSNIAHYLSPNCRLPTDVDFEVHSSSSPNPVHVGAHKCFLADASSVFDEMFFKGSMDDGGTGKVIVRVDDIDESVFRMFLKHLYGEQVEVGKLDIFSILEMSELVEKYKIKDLEEELVARIKYEKVNDENIIEIVEQLKKLTNPCVVKDAVEMKVSNYMQVNYGRSVSRLVSFLSEKSVDGESICYMMDIIAKAGVVDNEEEPDNDTPATENKRKILRRFLMFAGFPEEYVDDLVDKFIVEDADE